MSGSEAIAEHRGMTFGEWQRRHYQDGDKGPWGWRSDARYCSNACRQKAYRSRKAADA